VYASSYLVAIALYWRALANPSPARCRLVWALSFVVQGAWVALMIFETFFSRGGGGGLAGLLFMSGFAGSAVLSLAALLLEPDRPAASRAAPGSASMR
jgi:hypothetical protein